MFRPMRRVNQYLSDEECISILENGSYGTLAVDGDDGYPYAVPLSYVYSGAKIFFHCARSGHKTDAILKNAKVSFCVVGQDMVVPEEYTTYFKSVIVFGKARIMENETEIMQAVEMLAKKYSPDDSEENRRRYIDKDFCRMSMIALEIEHMTGKQASALARLKNGKDESAALV